MVPSLHDLPAQANYYPVYVGQRVMRTKAARGVGH